VLTLRIAAASVNQIPLDWQGNRRRLIGAIDSARAQGAQLVCLPELAISGYGCEDMFFSVGVQQRALEQLGELLPHTRDMLVAVGLPLFYESSLYNTAALLGDGKLLGIVCKQFMASDGLHYEPRWFRQWPAGVVGQLKWGQENCPVGDLLFDCGGVRIGFEICRDAWVAERPGARLARRGADLILNPSASHFAFGKQATRERFSIEGSRAFCATFVYCNLLGNESGRSVYDGGTLIASGGRMLARGRLFSYHQSEVTVVDVDIESTRRARAQSFDAMVKVAPPGDTLISSSFTWNVPSARSTLLEVRADPEPWETGNFSRFEEFARAVPLALFDYLRKSHAKGFVVSLSGGADSSAVAVLVSLMVRRAVADLGPGGFADRLPAIPQLKALVEQHRAAPPGELERRLTGALLACVYQATRYSSSTTQEAARQVAESIGADFFSWNVDAMVADYIDVVAAASGRPIDWQTEDVAMQNIQARSRGPGVWLLANLRGAILLATSNRSEAAVGYATMDGDTCGGLSPIAGIDKNFLLAWMRWMETTGPIDLGPLPILGVVNSQAPTAELRPETERQTDEGDLMPYAVLDAIERAAIRDKKLPNDVLETVAPQFDEYGRKQMGGWVIRFFELWCHNQWKRERYAPSFHVDDENLDPKSWCRFPILNSGFAEELELLGKSLK
jgi:NAD+ synthase (glutamine-hydrolysing)